MLQALFFDAGNTLTFMEQSRTLAPLHARGIVPALAQLHAAERFAKLRMDAARAASPADRSVDKRYWKIFYDRLIEELGLPADVHLRRQLVKATRQSMNWTFVLPGTADVLARLALRYRLGLISNADGQIAQLMEMLGLARYFASFTDSALVGCEKPDPRIFQAALRSLDVAPEEAMYIGDVYSLDYQGAKNVGMEALLFDVCGAYREGGLPRVASLQELQALLRLESR